MTIKQKIKTQLFEVLLPMPFNNTFTYKTTLDLNLNPGNFVKVPFREKIVNGCIWPTNKDSIKTILKLGNKLDTKEINQMVNLHVF